MKRAIVMVLALVATGCGGSTAENEAVTGAPPPETKCIGAYYWPVYEQGRLYDPGRGVLYEQGLWRAVTPTPEAPSLLDPSWEYVAPLCQDPDSNPM